MNLTLPRKGDILVVCPTELDDDGLALARVDLGEGADRRRLRVRVRGALPGDTVSARVESRQRLDVQTRMVELLTPDSHRVTPPCRHARYEVDAILCGGCTMQALTYERQLELKRQRVVHAMAVENVALEILPTRPAPKVFGHRHKMELSFTARSAPTEKGAIARGVALGLHPPGYRWEVVELAECRLLSPAMSAFLPELGPIFSDEALGLLAWDPRHDEGFLRNLIVREAQRTTDRMLEIVTTPLDPVTVAGQPMAAADLMRQLGARVLEVAARFDVNISSLLWTVQISQRGKPTVMRTTLLSGRPTLTEHLRVGGQELVLDVDPRAFFQPHPLAAEGLIEEVISRMGTARTVLDLYCGTGTLGLAVAPFCERVVGVELVPEAVESAKKNAARNSLNAIFHAGDVGQVVADPDFRRDLGPVDVVLLDPPRTGLLPGALAALVALGAPRVIYVSCKPESLARDLRALDAVGYRPDEAAKPVDLFPQSHHVETVVSLSRTRPG